MKKLLFLVVLLSLGFLLNAQSSLGNSGYSFNPNYKVGSLFDPNIVKMNHSMSFMSGVSSTGAGFYQSAYTNHLQFKLRENLKFNVDISVLNLGSMTHNNDMKFSGNDDNQNMIVPAFSLQYKPTENSTIYFEYRQMRGHQYPYYRTNEWWQ